MHPGFNRVRDVTRRLRADGILASLFIDPDADNT
jgi:pyridoxine 5'-phosphate synthase PdxJ